MGCVAGGCIHAELTSFVGYLVELPVSHYLDVRLDSPHGSVSCGDFAKIALQPCFKMHAVLRELVVVGISPVVVVRGGYLLGP